MIIANISSADMRQIITSVMDYWRDQPGVGVNIVDKLLNYKILTPTSVIEWALVDKVERGAALAISWIYELISSTTTKVANRVRAIVRASRQPGLPVEQGEVLRQSLETEMADMRALFAIIEDVLIPIRDGNQDQMMESSDALREEEAMVKMWGAKYLRVFQRKLAVEESWVKDELLKPIPAPPPEPMEEVEITATGNGETNGNGDAEEEERGGKRAKLDDEENID
jgi:nuclear cap-binding protein subunit 1